LDYSNFAIMNYKTIYFSGHATVQMFKRKINVDNVELVIKSGEVIKSYPDDKPYPSFLILGFFESRPIHVVASVDQDGNCYIITTYEPDLIIWNETFTIKKI
jgi:hypothetical protein